ncbi:MAG TPA: aminoglycoside phosphotransferase family protein [Actinocrinis sp.]|uniref:aminoglycoside phosphotransferase family protein n=1 Tax=Actinocrinis sp. TaxID=1920516 RepID=UPI002D679B68|nr:aminoglycoside phosphotransferase family protein [Actinocrinis sp.]HZU56374.1 aminoglycoside phosphotransferase family protein [Actinocrinis sp.]
MHADQLTITPDMVRDLVRDQFPAWRDYPIREVASQGTVNAIFRIGDDQAARFPLKPDDVEATRRSMEREAQAASELAGRTRFPTPEPVAVGEPGRGYPLPWSVQTWIPGDVATPTDLADSIAFAHDLAEFIRGVRAIDPRGRKFSGEGRGGDLEQHDPWIEICLEKCEGFLDVPRLRQIWSQLRLLPRAPEDVMTHGDLIPGNVLVAGDRLVGVLDVGGFGPADPALDLVCAWHLLDAAARRQLREDLACDDLQWQRGKAWAFHQAIGAAWYYRVTNPAMSHLGQVTLSRLMADELPAAA